MLSGVEAQYWQRISFSIEEFILLAVLFSLITLATKGGRALLPTVRQSRNWRVNLAYFSFDLIVFVPKAGEYPHQLRPRRLQRSQPICQGNQGCFQAVVDAQFLS